MDATTLKKLLDIGRQMAETRELDPLLEKAMALAIDIVGAEYGYLVLLELPNELVFRVGLDKDGNRIQEPQEQISRTILEEVISSKEAKITADAISVLDTASVMSLQIRSVICAPLISRGNLLGAIYIENRSESDLFDEDDLTLLTFFAAQAAVSIENAMLNSKLEARVKARTAELADVNAKLREEIDIRKKAEAAAKKANQAKSTFLASMSHELRTPLNGILGYAQILKRKPALPQALQDGLSIIESSGKHLLMLINDVLDLAKVESGTIELYQTDFHLPIFLKSIDELIRIRAEQKGLTFRLVDVSAGTLPTFVHGDERRLRQVLLNLLGNAVKFTEHGYVRLKVAVLSIPGSEGEVRLHFEVRDTGIGIAPEDIHAIFAPYGQAGEMPQRMKGTGLGLAISRNLIQMMGGRLLMESTLGEGSRFWFELPITVVATITPSPPERAQTIVGINGEAGLVLIVDDNWMNRRVLIDLLSPLGFQTVEAENGRVALAKAIAQEPSLIITDLLMPEMDGFELIQNIRQTPSLQHTPIIAASASVYEKEQQKSLTLGSDAFLPKPIEAEQLFDLLQRLLSLEWLYQDAAPERSTTAAPAMVLPPADTLKILLDSAELGDVHSLLNHLHNLEERDAQFHPFVKKLRDLVRLFKMNRISALLEEYLSAPFHK